MFTYLKPNLVTVNYQKHFRFDGQIYPSVTTILNATKPQEAQQALKRWRKKIGEKQAQQIVANACRRGISIHSAIRNFLLKQELSQEIKSNEYWQSIQPVLEQVEQVHLIESAVYNSKQKYAGIFDCLGEWEGKLCLFDWKTASKPKKLEWIGDYCLQVTAYIAAINNLYDINIPQGIVVVALGDRPAQIFHLDADYLRHYWEQFLERLQLWEELQQL
jgi:ATP-dependent exoDNAse (exonuclease V) beta subunit